VLCAWSHPNKFFLERTPTKKLIKTGFAEDGGAMRGCRSWPWRTLSVVVGKTAGLFPNFGGAKIQMIVGSSTTILQVDFRFHFIQRSCQKRLTKVNERCKKKKVRTRIIFISALSGVLLQAWKGM
jgi:hypothetical protein